MFENQNKSCVWGCGGSRQFEIFPFLKIKPPLYYYKGLSGAHLHITIVLLSQPMFENQNKSCVWGCGGSRQFEIFTFLKIKPLVYYFKWLTGAHLDITITFYYHSQCLKTKIEFVFGGVVLADSPKVCHLQKEAPPVLVQRAKLYPFRNYHCLTIITNV